MNHRFFTHRFWIAASLLFVASALAQDGAEDDNGGTPERDPFAPSERIRQNGPDGPEGFVPQETPQLLPALALRGFVEDEAGVVVALLEVDERATYLVRKDDTISLPQQRDHLVIRIVEIGNLALTVEVGALRRVVVVR